MRIGFLFLHPFNESLGSTTRLIEISKTLNEKGHDVLIYTPYEKNAEIYGVRVKNLKILGAFTSLFRKTYPILKKIYYGKRTRKLTAYKIFDENTIYNRIAKKLAEALEEDKVDILVTEQDFSLYPATKAAKKQEVPLIADIHNITAEELVAAKIIESESEEYNYMQRRLADLLADTDALIVVSKALENYIKEEYRYSNPTIIVPPSGRPRLEKLPEREPPYKIIYSGMVEYRERVDLFVESLSHLKERNNLEIHLTKKGSEIKRIERRLKEIGIKANFYWFTRREDLFDFMSKCHIGILTSSKDKARILGPPIKLLDYMSVGLPVVANYIGGWSDMIREEEIGILTEDDPKSFAEGIKALTEDEELYWKLARNALNAVREKYNWNKAIKPLEKLLKKL